MTSPNPSAKSSAHSAVLQSANPFFASQAQRIAFAREQFFEDGQRPTGLVPEPVIQSWIRCIDARMEPAERLGFDPVTKSRISNVLARNRQLLEAAQADLSQLDETLAGTACKAILTSHDGVVIRSTPTTRGEGVLMPIVTRIGVNLDENTIGTGAPSISARTGEVSVVRGAEHFFVGIHVMNCAAAPIRHVNGQLAGVLDLSIEGAMFSFDPTVMVRQYATIIENHLFEAQSKSMLLVRFQYSADMLGSPLQGLAAIDESGRVVYLNQIGSSLLACERVPHTQTTSESLFGLGIEDLLAKSLRAASHQHVFPGGLKMWIQVHLDAAQTSQATTAYPVFAQGLEDHPETIALTESLPSVLETTLHNANRALIESTLAAFNGNVAKAARKLGVSRGLLYRRLGAWSR